VHIAGRHHQAALARREHAVDDAHVRDDAAVGVVHAVENHRPGRRVRVADRVRHFMHDVVEQLGDTLTGLGADAQNRLGIAADDVSDLGGVLLRLCCRQVDLVEHGDDVQVVLEREVEVGEGLRLDSLCSIDEQDRALARGERAAHLVGEVDVPWSVDQIEDVRRAVDFPGQPDVLRLDGDAALALDVHAVEVLRAHVALLDDARQLQHPVGQRRLAVVDVGDDAEVADQVRVGAGHADPSRRGLGRSRSGDSPTLPGSAPDPAADCHLDAEPVGESGRPLLFALDRGRLALAVAGDDQRLAGQRDAAVFRRDRADAARPEV
jgi:hypothetical protein